MTRPNSRPSTAGRALPATSRRHPRHQGLASYARPALLGCEARARMGSKEGAENMDDQERKPDALCGECGEPLFIPFSYVYPTASWRGSLALAERERPPLCEACWHKVTAKEEA